MDRLSPELVLEIFDLAVHSGDKSYPGFPARVPQQDDEELSRRFFKCDEYPKFMAGIAAHETNTTSPVHLGHVCQQWREIVFGQPKLWSTVYVTDGGPGCVQLLKLWLEKSGERLLRVVFRDGGEPAAPFTEDEEEYKEEYREYDDEEDEEGTNEESAEEAEGKRIVEMLELMAAHKHRWETFKLRLRRIRLEPSTISEPLWPHPKVPENLRAWGLDFQLPKTKSDYRWNCFVTDYMSLQERVIGASPRLNELQLWGYVPAGLRKHIPCDRLSTLTLHKVTIDFYSELLDLLPKLQALCRFAISLGASQDGYRHRAKRCAITLPSLQQLVIVGHCNVCNNDVLSLLHLPALTDLSIHTSSSCRHDMELNLQACLDKWKPQLRRLALRDEQAGVFEDRYISLLRHRALQAVSDLRLGGVVTEKFLHVLTSHDGSTVPLLPALERVHFGAVLSNSTYDQCPLTQLVLARSNSTLSARLQSVHAGFERVEDMEAENAFWSLSEGTKSFRGKVDKRFTWIGTGPWKLDREFMCSDFSLIQGWEERAFG